MCAGASRQLNLASGTGQAGCARSEPYTSSRGWTVFSVQEYTISGLRRTCHRATPSGVSTAPPNTATPGPSLLSQEPLGEHKYTMSKQNSSSEWRWTFSRWNCWCYPFLQMSTYHLLNTVKYHEQGPKFWNQTAWIRSWLSWVLAVGVRLVTLFSF